MMLVMRGNLLEFVFQSPDPRHAVHELEVPLLFVVQAGIIDNCAANRLVYPPGDVERHLRIIKALGPGILIEDPENLTRLAENPANAVEENRLAISEMVEYEPDGPLARRVRTSEVALVEREVFQRLVSGIFEPSDNLHSKFFVNVLSPPDQSRWLSRPIRSPGQT